MSSESLIHNDAVIVEPRQSPSTKCVGVSDEDVLPSSLLEEHKVIGCITNQALKDYDCYVPKYVKNRLLTEM